MSGARGLCILCNTSPAGRGADLVLRAAKPATPFSKVRLLLLEDGDPEGWGGNSEHVIRIGLSGDFLRDVLAVVRELSTCAKVKAVISDCSPYQAAVALIASSVMYDKVVELSVECGSTPQEICVANAALPHALGGREGRITRLKLLASTAGRCVPVTVLAEELGLSQETTLRHAYALSTAGLTRIVFGDGNPLVCGEVGPEAAALAEAITAIHYRVREQSTRGNHA